jgi:acetyl esterase/lipase
MSTRHLIEPEALEFITRLAGPPLSLERLPEVRKYADGLLQNAAADQHFDVEVRETAIPGPSGAPDIPVVIYVPGSRTRPSAALLHLHGGGFVAGSARAEASWSMWLAHELGVAVVAPNYRLAPETPHPGPIEDCYATLGWLCRNAASLDVDVGRIAVFGGSAGGGLAAALALLARDRREYALQYQCLLYPMLDDRTGVTTERNAYAGEFVITAADNAFCWQALLGHPPGVADESAYAAPARAADLHGLPPAYIWVGALDLFVDECIEYGRRLVRSGVPTELHVYPGVTHGNILCEGAPSTQYCRAEVLKRLRAALH